MFEYTYVDAVQLQRQKWELKYQYFTGKTGKQFGKSTASSITGYTFTVAQSVTRPTLHD